MSSSAKRIQKELAEISLDPPPSCSAGPKGDNIYEWVSTIIGPSGKLRSNHNSCLYFLFPCYALRSVSMWRPCRACAGEALPYKYP